MDEVFFQNVFRSTMKESETIFVGDSAVPIATYRAGSKLGFNTDLFRMQNPSLYEQYCTKPPSRTLRIGKLKEEK